MVTHFLSIVALSIQAGCPDPTAITGSPNLQRQIAVEGNIISAAIDSLYATSTRGRYVVQAVNMQIVEPIAMDFRSYLASASDAGGAILDDYIRRNSEACDLGPQFIGSGTVGNGCGLELGLYLEHGDTIELEVEKIGVLRNKVERQDV